LRDTKAIVAYSSVAHMNLLLLLLLRGRRAGKGGGSLIMVSHGLVSLLLFYVVGEWYGYLGTRLVYHIRGTWLFSPAFSFFRLLVFMANAGVPPFLGFYREVVALGLLYTWLPLGVLSLRAYFILSLYYSMLLGIRAVVGKGGFVVPSSILFPVIPMLRVSLCFVFL
jgi:NADH:ubiquinone oxidoreductase subunit 4 (subunit M)